MTEHRSLEVSQPKADVPTHAHTENLHTQRMHTEAYPIPGNAAHVTVNPMRATGGDQDPNATSLARQILPDLHLGEIAGKAWQEFVKMQPMMVDLTGMGPQLRGGAEVGAKVGKMLNERNRPHSSNPDSKD